MLKRKGTVTGKRNRSSTKSLVKSIKASTKSNRKLGRQAAKSARKFTRAERKEIRMGLLRRGGSVKGTAAKRRLLGRYTSSKKKSKS